MGTMTIEKQIEEIRQTQKGLLDGVGDLANIVKNIAEHVYAEDDEGDDMELSNHEDMDAEEEVDIELADADMEMEDDTDDLMLEDVEEDVEVDEFPVEAGMNRMRRMDEESDVIEGDDMEKGGMRRAMDDEEVMDVAMKGGMKKSRRRKVHKGYANTSRRRSSEEDSPFGEQQSDMRGLAPVDDWGVGGERDEETFNMKFARMNKQVTQLQKELSAVRKAKAITPPIGDVQKSRRIGGGGGVITREVQEQVKSRSWAELNHLRTMSGDLPSHGV